MASLAAARAAGVQAPVRGMPAAGSLSNMSPANRVNHRDMSRFATNVTTASAAQPGSNDTPNPGDGPGSGATPGTAAGPDGAKKRGGMRRLSLMNNTQITATLQAAMAQGGGASPAGGNDPSSAAAAAAAAAAAVAAEGGPDPQLSEMVSRARSTGGGKLRRMSALLGLGGAEAAKAAAASSHHDLTTLTAREESQTASAAPRKGRRMSALLGFGGGDGAKAAAAAALGVGASGPSISGTPQDSQFGSAAASGMDSAGAQQKRQGRRLSVTRLFGGKDDRRTTNMAAQGALALEMERIQRIETLYKGVVECWKKVQ